MAAHPPTGPTPPNDGSGIFRRSVPKPPAKATPLPPDDFGPEEPTELLDLSDGDSIPMDELAAAGLPHPPDTEPVEVDRALFVADGPTTEPLPAGADAETVSYGTDAVTRTAPGDSSVLLGPNPQPTLPGSGWFDTATRLPRTAIPPYQSGGGPPSTGKFVEAADLFADLTGNTPDSGTSWMEDNATGRVSESELMQAFDDARGAEGLSHGELDLDGASGVNLVGPSSGSGRLAEDSSSIFSAVDAESGKWTADDVPLARGTEQGSVVDPFQPQAEGGSSIFERSMGGTLRAKADTVPDEGRLAFDLPEVDDPTGASQASGRIDLNNPEMEDVVTASGVSLNELDLASSEKPTGATDDDLQVPDVPPRPDKKRSGLVAPMAAVTAAGVAAATAKKASGAVKGTTAPAKPKSGDVDLDDDEAAEKPGFGRSAGFGKFVGGTAFGLLASGVTFAGLYLGGVIPNERKDATAAVRPAANTGDPDAAAKLAEAQKQLADATTAADTLKKELEGQLATAKKDADGVKQKLTDAQTAAEKATDALKTAQADATAAKKDAETATKAATDAKKEADTVRTELITAKADATAAKKVADTATAELTTAKKDATALKTDLDAALKTVVEKQRQFETAEVAALSAAKKQKAAEDTVAGVVKELEAAKLLDPKEAADLPAAIKRLTASATAGDGKKAAEALLAAQKDLDKAKAELKTAADDAAKAKKVAADAETAVTAAKADADKQMTALKTAADKQLADAKAGVDEKVKTAVDAATKDTQKTLDAAKAEAAKAKADLTAAVGTAKAEAKAEVETAMKKQVADAQAKATQAEQMRAADAKAFEQKLADQSAQFAARLADAKSGAVTVVTPMDTIALDRAAKSYADGLTLFLAGRYADAETQFTAAVAGNAADARYWYYLGMSHYQSGKTTEAAGAFRRGAELEARNKPGPKAVGESLERVPLALRRLLADYRQ